MQTRPYITIATLPKLSQKRVGLTFQPPDPLSLSMRETETCNCDPLSLSSLSLSSCHVMPCRKRNTGSACRSQDPSPPSNPTCVLLSYPDRPMLTNCILHNCDSNQSSRLQLSLLTEIQERTESRRRRSGEREGKWRERVGVGVGVGGARARKRRPR